MACEQERLWELQYLQYKTEIVAIKKSKKCNKKREIFSFFKKFICFICETFAFQRAEKEPAASAICGNQARPDFGVRPGTGKRRRRIHRLRLNIWDFRPQKGSGRPFPDSPATSVKSMFLPRRAVHEHGLWPGRPCEKQHRGLFSLFCFFPKRGTAPAAPLPPSGRKGAKKKTAARLPGLSAPADTGVTEAVLRRLAFTA